MNAFHLFVKIEELFRQGQFSPVVFQMRMETCPHVAQIFRLLSHSLIASIGAGQHHLRIADKRSHLVVDYLKQSDITIQTKVETFNQQHSHRLPS